MSPNRHPEDDVLVRTYAVTHPPGLGLPLRRYPWFQIVHALSGVMSVHTDEGSWVVPPHRAVWIPANREHHVTTTGAVTLRTLYFSGSAFEAPKTPPFEQCRGLTVSPLLRELIVEACHVGILFGSNPVHARLAAVVLDQLQADSTPALRLPMPRDPRAVRLAERFKRDPTSTLSIDEVAKKAGASRRTLERLFVAETQLTLGRWRHRLRMIEAIKLLAEGNGVTQTAADVGFESPSAFVLAFKRDLGTTPGRYFERSSGTDD